MGVVQRCLERCLFVAAAAARLSDGRGRGREQSVGGVQER